MELIITDLIINGLMIVLAGLMFLIGYKFIRRMFSTPKIAVLACEIDSISHNFYPAERVSSERLNVFKPDNVLSLYCAVDPVRIDFSNHPNVTLARLKTAKVYLYDKGRPYTFRDFGSRIFIEKERKDRVLIERGHYEEKDDQIIPRQCTDIDFCRADYAFSVLIDLYGEFQEAGVVGFSLSETEKLLLLSGGVTIFYLVIRFQLLGTLLQFVGALL